MKKIFSRLMADMKGYGRLLGVVILFSLVGVLSSLAAPQLLGMAIDGMKGQSHVDFPLVYKILGALAACYAVGTIAQWFSIALSNRLSYTATHTLRRQLFARLNVLPIRFHDNTAHGEVTTRFINDMEAVGDGLLNALVSLIQGVITIVGAIVFMLVLDPLMTLVVILSSPLAYMVARFITVRSQKLFKETARYVGQINGFAEEAISGHLELQAFGRESAALATFTDINEKLKATGTASQFISAMANPSTRIVNNLTYAAIGIIGGLTALSGNLTVGELSSFLLYAGIFAKPFNEITGVLSQLQAAAASAERVFSLMDAPGEIPDTPTAELTHPQGRIDFTDVVFSYDPGHPLITDLNLSVPPGSRVAIVGRTGAGKTTLVNLLMRFYDVDKGEIRVDGIPMKSLARHNLRQQFGMVLQDTWLFTGTIRDNIAYGKPDATREEVIHAAQLAGADVAIRKLPQGYDTVVSGNDSGLSQGQVQLITIARVLLADPPMLILDEATSNIDTFTEKKVQEAFQILMQGRTSFVIAHRLSTIRTADIILVMEKGNIVERGTHSQLMEKKEWYYDLYTSQFSRPQEDA